MITGLLGCSPVILMELVPAGKSTLTIFLRNVIFDADGEMSERFKEPVLKTGDAATHRGFESHSLRHNKISALEMRSRGAFLCVPLDRKNCEWYI